MTTTNNQSAARPAGLVSCAQMMQDFDRRRHDMRAVTPTGIRALDQALRGGMRSELLLAGGKAGVGKTDLAVNIALSFAQTRQVIFVTIELSPNQILFRTVTSFGAHLGKDGALTEQQILQGRRQRPVTGHLRKNRGGISGVDIELLYTPELHLFE